MEEMHPENKQTNRLRTRGCRRVDLGIPFHAPKTLPLHGQSAHFPVYLVSDAATAAHPQISPVFPVNVETYLRTFYPEKDWKSRSLPASVCCSGRGEMKTD